MGISLPLCYAVAHPASAFRCPRTPFPDAQRLGWVVDWGKRREGGRTKEEEGGGSPLETYVETRDGLGMCQGCEAIAPEPLWKALQRKGFVLPIRALWPGLGKQGVDVYEMSAGGSHQSARRGTIVKEHQPHIHMWPFSFEGKGHLHTSPVFYGDLVTNPSIVSIPIRKNQQARRSKPSLCKHARKLKPRKKKSGLSRAGSPLQETHVMFSAQQEPKSIQDHKCKIPPHCPMSYVHAPSRPVLARLQVCCSYQSSSSHKSSSCIITPPTCHLS